MVFGIHVLIEMLKQFVRLPGVHRFFLTNLDLDSDILIDCWLTNYHWCWLVACWLAGVVFALVWVGRTAMQTRLAIARQQSGGTLRKRTHRIRRIRSAHLMNTDYRTAPLQLGAWLCVVAFAKNWVWNCHTYRDRTFICVVQIPSRRKPEILLGLLSGWPDWPLWVSMPWTF